MPISEITYGGGSYGSGPYGDPQTAPRQAFATTDVLRLEVQNTPTGPLNLVQNPSGDLGGWGWITPSENSSIYRSGYHNTNWLTYQAANADVNFLYPEYMPIAPGQWAAARWVQANEALTAGLAYVAARIVFFDASSETTGIGPVTAFGVGTTRDAGGTVFSVPAVQAPAGTVKARLLLAVARDSAGNPPLGQGMYLREVTVAKAATAAALTGLAYLEPATYTDILGPTHTLAIGRDELNIGTLTAEIIDAALDPSQSDLVRPGKRVRVMANTSGSWSPIFTGKVARATTTYDPRRTDAKRARVTLTALDPASPLAQVTRKNGVAHIAELPYVLEGAGVPWNINGSGDQVLDAPVVTTSDAATVIDQVAITRDSELGYAWIDRSGVLNVWDRATIPTTPAATLDELAYSDLAVDYDTDRCINAVAVKARQINLATGQTVEVSYGPYLDQDSVNQWGPHSAEFTVQGIAEADVPAYAAAILAANATPALRINAVTLPIRTLTDIDTTKALLDLYDLVTVVNTNASISSNMRVTGVKHSITPTKWLVDLDFTTTNNVAAPQAVPNL